MRATAHSYIADPAVGDRKVGAWSLACGRLGQAKSCVRWSLAAAASGRPLDRDSEVIGSTGELPAAAAASGRPPADSDSASGCVSILDLVGSQSSGLPEAAAAADSDSASGCVSILDLVGSQSAASGRPDCDATKSKIDTDTESESESLNTSVGATEGERERDRERDREVQDITSLVFEPDQESNGDDHVVERKTSQSPKVVPKGEF